MAVTCRPTMLRRFSGLIGAIVFLGLTIYFIYDGWFNPAFTEGEQNQWQLFNQIGAFVLPIGLIASILWGARAARQSIVLDETGISVNEAEPIPLERITEIDDSTYEDDRYLRVKHRDKTGDEQTLVLDAQKFDGVDDLLEELMEVTGLTGTAEKAETDAERPPAEKKLEKPPFAEPAEEEDDGDDQEK